jgi:hypothetical protein
MKNYLAIDNLRENSMNLIEKYVDELDADHLTTFVGLLKDEKNLSIESETFGDDVGYNLNLCIEILTNLEDRNILSDKEKLEFDDICILTLKLSRFDAFCLNIGDLIIYEEKPYQITEIDYDDHSLQLSDSNYEYSFWIDFDDVK